MNDRLGCQVFRHPSTPGCSNAQQIENEYLQHEKGHTEKNSKLFIISFALCSKAHIESLKTIQRTHFQIGSNKIGTISQKWNRLTSCTEQLKLCKRYNVMNDNEHWRQNGIGGMTKKRKKRTWLNHRNHTLYKKWRSLFPWDSKSKSWSFPGWFFNEVMTFFLLFYDFFNHFFPSTYFSLSWLSGGRD